MLRNTLYVSDLEVFNQRDRDLANDVIFKQKLFPAYHKSKTQQCPRTPLTRSAEWAHGSTLIPELPKLVDEYVKLKTTPYKMNKELRPLPNNKLFEDGYSSKLRSAEAPMS